MNKTVSALTFLAMTFLAIALGATACGSDAEVAVASRDATGAIVEGGSVDSFEIKVGDCLGAGVTGEVQSVAGLPCTEPHQYEVYHLFTIPEGDGTYPGLEAVQDQADEGCHAAFEGFVGIAYDSSGFEISYISPTQVSWEDPTQKDRLVQCLIGQSGGPLTVGSARGSAK